MHTYEDISFKNWLSKFKDTDTSLGDLAVDVINDTTFPDSTDSNELMKYIRMRTPDKVVHKTLEAAIALYNAASESHDSPFHTEPYQL